MRVVVRAGISLIDTIELGGMFVIYTRGCQPQAALLMGAGICVGRISKIWVGSLTSRRLVGIGTDWGDL